MHRFVDLKPRVASSLLLAGVACAALVVAMLIASSYHWVTL
jgi:hypothetical protein